MCEIKSNRQQHRKARNKASKCIKPVELGHSILVIISLTSIVAIEYPWIMAKAYQPSDFLRLDHSNHQSHSKSFEDLRSSVPSKSRLRRFDRQLNPDGPRSETNRDPIKAFKATKRTRPAPNQANYAGFECTKRRGLNKTTTTTPTTTTPKTLNSSSETSPTNYQYKLKRFKRGFRSRPKMRTKVFGKITPILKKPTPTKVIIGAHLGTLAYRKYTNWTSSAKAANQTSVSLNGTQILTNGTLSNNTWLVPVDVGSNSTRLVALNSSTTVINLDAGNETLTPGATINITLDDDATNSGNSSNSSNSNNDDDDDDDDDDKQPKTLTLVEIVPFPDSNTYPTTATTTNTKMTSAAKSPIKSNNSKS